jgi:hypothetical protein
MIPIIASGLSTRITTATATTHTGQCVLCPESIVDWICSMKQVHGAHHEKGDDDNDKVIETELNKKGMTTTTTSTWSSPLPWSSGDTISTLSTTTTTTTTTCSSMPEVESTHSLHGDYDHDHDHDANDDDLSHPNHPMALFDTDVDTDVAEFDIVVCQNHYDDQALAHHGDFLTQPSCPSWTPNDSNDTCNSHTGVGVGVDVGVAVANHDLSSSI